MRRGPDVLDIYFDGLQALWQYPEFQTVLQACRYVLLALAAGVLIIGLLHALYMLGFDSPLYRRRSPRVGWSKRILPAVTILFLAFTGLFWLSGRWIAQAP